MLRGVCDHVPVNPHETDAVVLRAIHYSEADSVLSVYTRDMGRVSAMAKGVRKPTSRMGGRVQPGVWSRLTLHKGRGDMYSLRGAQVVRTHAGLWTDARRLGAASCVLEAAMRVLPEEEPNEEAFALLVRALGVLAECPAPTGPAHLHPVVLGFGAKLLVVSGLLPQLQACVVCGAPPPAAAFSARQGGVTCAACREGVRIGDGGRVAAVRLLMTPLKEIGDSTLAPADALDVERMIGAVLGEHLGLGLRSASPG